METPERTTYSPKRTEEFFRLREERRDVLCDSDETPMHSNDAQILFKWKAKKRGSAATRVSGACVVHAPLVGAVELVLTARLELLQLLPTYINPAAPQLLVGVSSSVESFYRGAVAGGVFGLVFGPETGVGVVAHLMAPFRPALLAGSWCLLTSFSSCALSRDGLPFPWNGALSGLFSGAVISLVSRWPRESIAWTMAGSSVLSILSHYATEGQGVKASDRPDQP
ncbi:unnamed protein product [Durusdinium trenchii]|uniref:Mitochondrial import inner membrane translocase subunit TIM22 n=1 Tax=Durusdinium trenchii TaxID=1381693 RepID=A0ABP0H673_9DINO